MTKDAIVYIYTSVLMRKRRTILVCPEMSERMRINVRSQAVARTDLHVTQRPMTFESREGQSARRLLFGTKSQRWPILTFTAHF